MTGFSKFDLLNNLLVLKINKLLLLLLLIPSISMEASGYLTNSLPLNKQIADSDTLPEIDSTKVVYFESSFDNLKLGKIYPIDTSITYFQQYDPLTYHNKLYSTLSNIGLAAKNQVFSPTLSSGYNLEYLSFKNYIFDNKQVKYYHQLQPFTEIFYVMGSKKEQNLKVKFTRQLFKGFTLGMQFGLNNSPGPYKNSKTNDTRVFFTGLYQTPNKRYGILANYLHNKLEMQENGGITNDTLFEEDLEKDRRVIPVYLDNASNLVKKSGFYIEQYFNLQKPEREHDSSNRKINVGSISYTFQYQRNQLVYTDPDGLSDFYIGHSAPIDSASTYDSIYQENISNGIKWSSLTYSETADDKRFYLYFGLKQNQIRQSYAYDSVDEKYNQLISSGGLGINIGNSFYLNVNAEYTTGNYNGGDFKINGVLNQFLGKKVRNAGQLEASFTLLNKTPDWYFNKYKSNFYRWENDLKKEKYTILDANYSYRNITAGGKFFTVENYTYLDDSIRPSQIEKAETVMQLYIDGTISWKSLGMNARAVYQETSQPNIIRLPKLSGTADIYFKHTIFKKAATLKTGFQLTYFTAYYADAYMPALRLFYLQNDKKIGDYVFVDYYLTLVVKRARMFFKLAHVNGYFGDYRYYSAPSYPARDARFYFGIDWRFHD